MNPKISVIVPVYNVESFIEEALDSLLNQTFINEIEVLMIDDESKDNSRYIIEKYALDYDNFHAFHKSNGGPGVARNYGLDRAKGEFIYFMDSDDYLVPDALEKLYGYAIGNDLEVVTSNFVRFNQNKSWEHPIGEFIYSDIGNVEHTSLYEYPNLSWDMTLWNKVYRRDFLENNNIRFFDRDVLFEDNLFSNEVLIKSAKVGILNEYLYCWRRGSIGSSLTQSYYIDRGRDLLEMISLVMDLLSSIDDEVVLDKKYLKLLVIDLPYFVEGIHNYPKQTHEDIFKYVYDMVNRVPERYFSNLNTYYSTLYDIILNRDWDDLLLLVKINKRNPVIPKDLNEKYKKQLDFKKDAIDEKMKVFATKITFDEKQMIMKLNPFIYYLGNKITSNLSFKIVNSDYGEIDIDPQYFKGTTLNVPYDLLKCGVNRILATYSGKDMQKSRYVFAGLKKMHETEDYDFEICFDKTEDLKIIKREKNNNELIITDIELNDGVFRFTGKYNGKTDSVVMNDQLSFAQFSSAIDYLSDDEFIFEIDYAEFLKAPIKNWTIKSYGNYSKINVQNQKQFIDEKYIITIENYGNSIQCRLELYDSVEMMNKLNREVLSLKDKNDSLKEKNIKLTNKIEEFKSRKVVRLMDKIKR